MIGRLRNLARDDRGAAVIELALIAPVLALITVGAIDMANAFGHKLALEQAAQRAMEKVQNTTGAKTIEDTIKVEAATQANIPESQVTVTFRLECGTAHTVQADPHGNCPNATDESNRYIFVAVTDTYTPIFSYHFSGIKADGTYHIGAKAGVRVQ